MSLKFIDQVHQSLMETLVIAFADVSSRALALDFRCTVNMVKACSAGSSTGSGAPVISPARCLAFLSIDRSLGFSNRLPNVLCLASCNCCVVDF